MGIAAGPSLTADESQRPSGIDNGDARVTTQRQQVLAIPRDDQVSLGGHRGGDDLIVIDIAGHDAWHGHGSDEFDDLDVISEYCGRCRIDEREALGGRGPSGACQ